MIIYVTIIIAGILLDQLTKLWASRVLSGMTTYSIIPNVLHFTYVENTGAAFNIFSDKQIFLIIITLIFILLLGYLFILLPKTKSYNLANLALSLMLSGAIGNLIDRMTHSYVIDFIDLRVINFAVFNVADSLVVIGACLLLYAYLKNQLRLPARIAQETTQEEDEQEVEEPKRPLRKDVLKDLKPKKISRDLKPEVRTDIIQLKSFATADVEPAQFKSKEFFNDYSALLDDLRLDSNEVTFENENRFSEQTDHYLNSIKDQNNEEEKFDRKSYLKTRFNDRIHSYEESIKRIKEESSQKEEEYPNWNPEGKIKEPNRKSYEVNWHPEIEHTESTKKTYEIDWNPQFDLAADKARARFKNQIDHYAQSIEEQRQNLKEEPEVIESEIIEEVEIGIKQDEPESSKNRYEAYIDSYLNSIEEAKKKTYVNKENEE